MADNAQELFSLLRQFPLLLPNRQFTSYTGIMEVEGIDFNISLHLPHYPSLIGMSCKISSASFPILNDQRGNMQELSRNSSSLLQYLRDLQKLLESVIKEDNFLTKSSKELLSIEYYKKTTAELEKIGFENIAYISPCLKKIKLQTTDEFERCHVIDIGLNMNYPERMCILVDLPEHIVEEIKQEVSLTRLYQSFVEKVSGLQEVWNMMDVIDSCCWVLDPEHPSRKDLMRRIAIDKNISLYLKMDSNHPQCHPFISILGPEDAIIHIQQHVQDHMKEWKVENSVIDNLKLVLGLDDIPGKPSSSDPGTCAFVHQGECNICFTLRLDGDLPSEVCDNSVCSCSFHTSCLAQWLQTVAGNYRSFGRVHGTCPNCGTTMSCPVTN